MQDSVVPPPWKLTGDGYVIFFRFPRDFALQFIPEALQDRFRGGLGALAFVDYKTSDVGGYRELLFIPGRFDDGKKARHSITQIYVSTYSSVISGRANWGIPKERAGFDLQMRTDGSDVLSASALNGDPILELIVRQGVIKLPIPHTRLCPISIVQWWEGQQFNTRFWGSGRLSLLDVEGVQVNGALFPDVTGQTPIGAFKISDFSIVFNVPKTTPAP